MLGGAMAGSLITGTADVQSPARGSGPTQDQSHSSTIEPTFSYYRNEPEISDAVAYRSPILALALGPAESGQA
jgi:hypothetical protein